MNEYKIGDIWKEPGKRPGEYICYVLKEISQDGSLMWVLLSDQPERSKREDNAK